VHHRRLDTNPPKVLTPVGLSWTVYLAKAAAKLRTADSGTGGPDRGGYDEQQQFIEKFVW